MASQQKHVRGIFQLWTSDLVHVVDRGLEAGLRRGIHSEHLVFPIDFNGYVGSGSFDLRGNRDALQSP